jgi:hypothetical protein
MSACLDENCGSDARAMALSGMRGMLSEAVSIYFADAALVIAFVARWCAGTRSRLLGASPFAIKFVPATSPAAGT